MDVVGFSKWLCDMRYTLKKKKKKVDGQGLKIQISVLTDIESIPFFLQKINKVSKQEVIFFFKEII